MKDRIRQLMESQHLSQQSFADVLQISPASLSSIFNDRTKPTLNHVDAIRKKFPMINLDWLLYGNEPMFLESGNDVSDSTASSPALEPMLDFGAPAAPSHSAERHDTAPQKVSGHRMIETTEVKYVDKPQRQIAEIRIFYDDQTWETFVPKK